MPRVVTNFKNRSNPSTTYTPLWQTCASLAISYSLPDGQDFFIGAYFGSCSLGFTGSIDEVRLFNRALSPSEILGPYQTTPSI